MPNPSPTVNINITLTKARLLEICERPKRLGPDTKPMKEIGRELTKLVFQAIMDDTYHISSGPGRICAPIARTTFENILRGNVSAKEMGQVARRVRAAAFKAYRDPEYVLPPRDELDDGATRRRKAMEKEKNGAIVVEGDEQSGPIVIEEDEDTQTGGAEQKSPPVIDLETEAAGPEEEDDETQDRIDSQESTPDETTPPVETERSTTIDLAGGSDEDVEEEPSQTSEPTTDTPQTHPTITIRPGKSTNNNSLIRDQPKPIGMEEDQGRPSYYERSREEIDEMIFYADRDQQTDPNFDPATFRRKVNRFRDGLRRAPDNLNDIVKGKETVRYLGEQARAVDLPSDMGESSGPVIRKRKAQESGPGSHAAKKSKSGDQDQRQIDDMFRVSKIGQVEGVRLIEEGAHEGLPPLEEIPFPYELVKGKLCRYLCCDYLDEKHISGHIHDEKPVEWAFLMITNAITKEQAGGAFCKLTTIKELRDRAQRALHPSQELGFYHRGKLVPKADDWNRLGAYKMKGREDREFIVASKEYAAGQGWC